MRIRTYSEMMQFPTYEERFAYLVLDGEVGSDTFGSDRWLNQDFYRSSEWKRMRDRVLARDLGCDLGCEGLEVYYKPIIHHMNPMTREALAHGDEAVLDERFLITTSHRTHNAIHFGRQGAPEQVFAERRPGDTNLW